MTVTHFRSLDHSQELASYPKHTEIEKKNYLKNILYETYTKIKIEN